MEDTERCPRYIGAAVEGLSVKPAPFRTIVLVWRLRSLFAGAFRETARVLAKGSG